MTPQEEIEFIQDAVHVADSSYLDYEVVAASDRQVIAVNGMLNRATGYLPRPHRLVTLAVLCGYKPEYFPSSKQLTLRGASAFIQWGYGKDAILKDAELLPGRKEAILLAAEMAKEHMNPLRRILKKALLASDPGAKCPKNGQPATDLHEIIAWPGPGNKYGISVRASQKEAWEEMAVAYFVPELCVLVSNAYNLDGADNDREWLLSLNAQRYGTEAVVDSLRNLASKLKSPKSFIPASISFDGETVEVLCKQILAAKLRSWAFWPCAQ